MDKGKCLILAAAAFAAGCSHSGTVSKIATDYNRAMATSRDEQLLINILRAAGREPLMFSVIGEVTGSAQDGASLEIATENLLTSAANVINPTLGLEGSAGPTIQVKPLSSKEFTEGILKPITAKTLNYFMSQGWDAEFLLPLVLSGYRCEVGREANLDASHANLVAGWGDGFTVEETSAKPALTNREIEVLDEEALRLMREGDSDGYTVTSITDVPKKPHLSKVILAAPALADVVVTVPDAEALKMMRSGVAGGYKVKAVLQDRDPGMARIVLTKPAEKSWEATFTKKGPTCPPPPVSPGVAGEAVSRSADRAPAGIETAEHQEASVDSIDSAGAPKIFAVSSEPGETGRSAPAASTPSLHFRSVEGILYYLGARFRPCLQRKGGDCSITYTKKVTPSEVCPGPAADAETYEWKEKEKGTVPVKRYLFRIRSAGIPSATAAVSTRHNGNNYWVDRLDECDTDRTLKTLSFLSQLIALQTEASDLAVTPSVIAVNPR